jgi:hypothetical protein
MRFSLNSILLFYYLTRISFTAAAKLLSFTLLLALSARKFVYSDIRFDVLNACSPRSGKSAIL